MNLKNFKLEKEINTKKYYDAKEATKEIKELSILWELEEEYIGLYYELINNIFKEIFNKIHLIDNIQYFTNDNTYIIKINEYSDFKKNEIYDYYIIIECKEHKDNENDFYYTYKIKKEKVS